MAQRSIFRDRRHAGEALADALADIGNLDDVLVLGLPRGGVIVARAVADALCAPLDVIVARRLGVPGLPEVALGAIAEGTNDVTIDAVAWYLGVPAAIINRIAQRERREIERRVRRFRDGRPLPDVRGRVIVLVDDGLASGATLRAAVQSRRQQGVSRIIVACPVGSDAGILEVAPWSTRSWCSPARSHSRWCQSGTRTSHR
ncbi:MAG: phosphoribosyltransferase family protein [Gemmatimonadota bacterium]